MKSVEDILSKNEVKDPTDAALVRLAATTLMQPAQSVERLVSLHVFASPQDKTLALALVETVRSYVPQAPAAKAPRWVWAALVVAGAVTIAALYSASTASSQADALLKTNGAITAKFEDLKKSTDTALTAAKVSTESATAATTKFVTSTETQLKQITEQASEIGRLKQANAELEAANAKLQLQVVELKSLSPKK